MEKRRPYRSELRQRRAESTRLQIRKAARKLFENKGFSRTTIAEIARAAGVAVPSVYAAFGTKAGIVGSMLEEVEQSVGIPERRGELFADPDPHRQLAAYVHGHVELFSAGAVLLRAALEASRTDARDLAERGNRRRRDIIDQLTTKWADNEALADGLTQREAAEHMWLLTSVETYLSATDDLGWSAEQYEAWLLALLSARILG